MKTFALVLVVLGLSSSALAAKGALQRDRIATFKAIQAKAYRPSAPRADRKRWGTAIVGALKAASPADVAIATRVLGGSISDTALLGRTSHLFSADDGVDHVEIERGTLSTWPSNPQANRQTLVVSPGSHTASRTMILGDVGPGEEIVGISL